MATRVLAAAALCAACAPQVDIVAMSDAGPTKTTLEKPLLELVRTRVSQINGCAYRLDMHSKDARAGGESEQRLYVLDAWREAPFYSERERAALAWAEALTLVADDHAPDEVYEEARRVSRSASSSS
jgi:AhpD family alkylhydroperoxidase